jgi:multidrug transporter EmrE-like cation transporter
MSNILLLFLTVLVSTLGQLLLKKGVQLEGGVSFNNEIIFEVIKIVKSPYIMCGLLAYVFAMALTLVALSRVEVSVFALFTSLSYVLVIFASYFFFNESITLVKLVGTSLIILGVYFIVKQ